MKRLFIAAVSTALFVPAAALAEPTQRFTQSYNSIYAYCDFDHYRVTSGGASTTLDAVTVGVEWRPTANFGFGGAGSFGVRGDTASTLVGDVEVDLKHDVGVYAAGYLPVSDNVELFARVGYGSSEIEASLIATGDSVSDSEESWRFGAGANIFLDDNNGVRLAYERREFNDDGGEADVWSLGYVRRF